MFNTPLLIIVWEVQQTPKIVSIDKENVDVFIIICVSEKPNSKILLSPKTHSLKKI